jgi:hypothetical protein
MKITNTSTVKALGLICGATSGMFAHNPGTLPIKPAPKAFYEMTSNGTNLPKHSNYINPYTSIVNVPPSRIWFDLKSTGEAASQTAIAYLAQGTLGIDFGYDAIRFAENNVLGIYTLIDNEPFTIQARPLFTETDMVQLGYEAPEEGTFSIAINRSDGVFAQGQSIYIKDNVTGTITDLTQEVYVFSSESGIYNERFTIGYSVEVLSTGKQLTPQAFTVFKSGETIGIDSGNSTIQNVTVYDTTGRVLFHNKGVNNNNFFINGLTSQQQVVIIETDTSEGKIRRKILY